MSRRGSFSWRRLSAVARMEWKQTLRRPMVWVLIIILGLMLFGLSRGNVTISTGDSSVGGDKAWVNSEFNLAFLTAIVGFMLYTFFVAIAAGMSVLRDDETKVSELLHSHAPGFQRCNCPNDDQLFIEEKYINWITHGKGMYGRAGRYE